MNYKLVVWDRYNICNSTVEILTKKQATKLQSELEKCHGDEFRPAPAFGKGAIAMDGDEQSYLIFPTYDGPALDDKGFSKEFGAEFED